FQECGAATKDGRARCESTSPTFAATSTRFADSAARQSNDSRGADETMPMYKTFPRVGALTRAQEASAIQVQGSRSIATSGAVWRGPGAAFWSRLREAQPP
ncbi:unnamed protein product, partial [Phaeothamnion confervicola]